MNACTVHFGFTAFTWFIIGAAFGANLIAGIVLWYRRPRRHRPEQVLVETPGILVTSMKRLTDEQVAEYKRRWVEAYGKRPRIDSPGSDVPSDQPSGVDAPETRTAGGRGIHDGMPT